jgi:mono/diheme cytochrome c family protein
MKITLFTAIALCNLTPLLASAQSIDQPEMKLAETTISELANKAQFSADGYTSTDGETLYKTLCAGCHMPDGTGAVGAGQYPVLKGNGKLKFSAYPIKLIVNGLGAMPSFGTFLDDEQVVAVTSYIQSHLGNDYTPDATVDAVADARPAEPADPNTAEHE